MVVKETKTPKAKTEDLISQKTKTKTPKHENEDPKSENVDLKTRKLSPQKRI